MKKIFGIALVLAVLTSLCFGSVALAAGPPDVVTVTWDGGGEVTGSVNATGDQTYNFAVNAGSTSGSFAMTNLLDNSYGYGVNATNAEFIATVSSGSATYTTVHTDNYVPMYGAAGQNTYSFIGASGGSASMAMYTHSNYAGMGEANYGHAWTPAGDTFSANATSFTINHWVMDSEGDFSQVLSYGSGTADLDCMSSDIGAGSLTFGQGAGCYTDASFDGTGTQTLQFFSSGHSSINQLGFNVPGNGSAGSASLNIIANFVGTFSVPNFSASVD